MENALEKIGSEILPDDYDSILRDLAEKIRVAQARAVYAVNFELVQLYREIGRTIYVKQQEASWGTSVVKRLARDLQNLFPGEKRLPFS